MSSLLALQVTCGALGRKSTQSLWGQADSGVCSPVAAVQAFSADDGETGEGRGLCTLATWPGLAERASLCTSVCAPAVFFPGYSSLTTSLCSRIESSVFVSVFINSVL